MNSPKQRYENDPNYRKMVDAMEGMIVACQYSPAEMREMAVMASIHYEMRHAFRHYTVPLPVNDAIKVMADWRARVDAEQKELDEKNLKAKGAK